MAGGRKLMVEVISARDLMPKDGQGSSNAYCVVSGGAGSGVFLVLEWFVDVVGFVISGIVEWVSAGGVWSRFFGVEVVGCGL